MLISIILPAPAKVETLHASITALTALAGDFELLIIGELSQDLDAAPSQVYYIPSSGQNYFARLHQAAISAKGEVLLFLKGDLKLPSQALSAIERNLNLLPQTIGGNFHLKFTPPSLLTRLLKPVLKRWRYQGYYNFDSPIFIRRQVYEALGGLRADVRWPEIDFVRRMEQYGPTLYLPDAVTAPPPSYRQVLMWLAVPLLMKLSKK